MAHMIDTSNGRANMAYVGASPWWNGDNGLFGARLQPGQSIDEWLIAAGMTYTVERSPVTYNNGTVHTFEGKDVLWRSDTHAPLGIVSSGYKIVQPAECMEFFREFCEENQMSMETAGVLKGGAVYWALAKTGKTLVIGSQDKTEEYVLMSTSADGTRATDNRKTAIRVVCNNTLSLANERGSKGAIKTRHNTTFDANAVKQKMGLAQSVDAWEQFSEQMHRLANKSVTQAEATEFFSELLRPAASRAKPRQELKAQSFVELLQAPVGAAEAFAETDKASPERAIRGLSDLMESYANAPGAVPGTAYGMLQGVTHYVDHVRGSNNADKRLTSAWFGQGDTLKSKALDALLAM